MNRDGIAHRHRRVLKGAARAKRRIEGKVG